MKKKSGGRAQHKKDARYLAAGREVCYNVDRSGIRRNEELGVLGMGHYMTYAERIRLETLLAEKKSVAYIAGKLGFSRQTIYNEIKRGSYLHTLDYRDEKRYSAQKGQQISQYNQTAKGRPLKIGTDHEYAAFLERKIMEERFSPAAALAAARRDGFTTSISVNTLYSYIDKRVFLTLSNKHLWEKRKKRPKARGQVRCIAHGKLPSIESRPDSINQRREYGHWEMDLVVSCKGGKSVLLTLTERMSRQEIIMKLPDRKAETVRRAIDRLERKTPDFRERFKSITTDNGSEFLQYDDLRKSCRRKGQRFDIYYCHSYSAWEKGSNENHNRMIRRWFPKGTNFDKVTPLQIQKVQDWMNRYPRKSLAWRYPSEIAA